MALFMSSETTPVGGSAGSTIIAWPELGTNKMMSKRWPKIFMLSIMLENIEAC